jgi:PAS domain S-box-containing protein
MAGDLTKPSYEELEAALEHANALLAESGVRDRAAGDESDAEIGELRSRLRHAHERTATERSQHRGAIAGMREASLEIARSEALHRAILDSATDYAIISLDGDGLVTSWNEGAFRIMGWTEEEMMGRPAHVFFTEDEVATGIPEQEMRQAIETGRGEDERFHLRKDGSCFWANGLMMPLEADGEHVGFVKILRDRTGQHEAQEALRKLAAELAFEQSTLRAVFENAPVGLSLAAADGGSVLLNEQMRRMLGRDISHGGIERYLGAGAIHDDGRAYDLSDYPQVEAIRHGVETHSAPFLIERPDGQRLRTEISSVALRDDDGRVSGAVSVVVDVEERERAAEHQAMLTGELAHRMKNTMAMVQAILHQSLRSADTLEDARENVLSRFDALVRAQDVLTSADWKPTDLGEIVRGALETVAGHGRVSVVGCAIEVGARASLSFTLVLHELATNATKYGALSTPDGRVEVRWSLGVDHDAAEPCLAFTWTETGGPPVAPPTRRGFGSRLIDSMGRTFGGRSELRYEPSGVRWLVEADPARLRIT